MYNKVKFVINKILSQNSNNKKGFFKIQKYNKKYFNSSTSIITRKFSSYNNPKPPNSDYLIIITTVGFLFFLYKNKK